MQTRIFRFFRNLLLFPLRLIAAPFTGFSRQSAEQTAEETAEPEPYTMTFEDFMENLRELRSRAMKAFFALILGTIVGAFFAGPVLEFLKEPYCRIAATPESCELIILGPTGGIVAYFRVALMLGAIIAIPMITYQVMMFVLPGLTPKEKRVVYLSIPPVTVLFLIGASFAWLVLMPPALGFLEGFQEAIFEPEWTADQYLGFVTALIFWMGVAFETPLVFFVLAILGFVTPGTLVRNWRVSIVGAAIAAAFITPTIDPVNMFLVMGPLMALYLISIVLVVIGRRIARLD